MRTNKYAEEIKKLLTIDPKSRYDKAVTIKFNTYDYEMLKELSLVFDLPMSTLIREIVYYTLQELKDIDKIN